MKKTLLLAAAALIGFSASAVENVVTLDNATTVTEIPGESDNKAVYVIQSQERGGLYAELGEHMQLAHCGINSNGSNDGLSWNQNVAVSGEDVNQQFSIITYNGKKYLYSVAAKAFIKRENNVGKISSTVDESSVITMEESTANGVKYFRFKVNNFVVNHSGGYDKTQYKGIYLAANASPDGGNRYNLQKLNNVTLSDVDYAAAIEALPHVTSATVNVTIDGSTLTYNNAEAKIGSSALELLPNYYGITVIAEEDTDYTISESNNEFNLQGEWKWFGKIGRMINRNGQDGRDYWYYDAAANRINCKKASLENSIEPERLFQINGKIVDNELVVSIQVVAAGANKYLNATNSNNNTASMEENEMFFKVNPNSTGTEGFSLKVPGSSNSHLQNYSDNANLGVWTGNSQNNDGSYISFKALTDEEFASVDWSGEIAAIDAIVAKTGTEFGKYHSTSDSFEADVVAAKAAINALGTASKPTFAQMTEATAKKFALAATLTFNDQLAPGFYRLKGSNGQYVNADANGTITMAATDDNTATTVFYYSPEGRLISLRSGLVLGNFTDGDSNKGKGCVLASNAKASVPTFVESHVAGKVYIKTAAAAAVSNTYSNHDCYIYGGNAGSVDRGAFQIGVTPQGASNADGYAWTIEEFTSWQDKYWLPVYVGETPDHVTICLPVDLHKSDRLTYYTLADNGQHAEIVKTKVEEGIIPANTPVYAEVNAGVPAGDLEHGCYFVPFTYPAPEAAALEETATAVAPTINGSFYATEKAEGTNYYTLGVKDGDEEASNRYFLAHTGEYIPGFSAHVATATPSAAVSALNGYKLVTEEEKTSGINEIVAEGAASKAIYDLQGRRVNNATKGIFIVNGKKALVK